MRFSLRNLLIFVAVSDVLLFLLVVLPREKEAHHARLTNELYAYLVNEELNSRPESSKMFMATSRNSKFQYLFLEETHPACSIPGLSPTNDLLEFDEDDLILLVQNIRWRGWNHATVDIELITWNGENDRSFVDSKLKYADNVWKYEVDQ